MKRLKQKDLYRFIPKFLIPHSSFLIARQREKWKFVGLFLALLTYYLLPKKTAPGIPGTVLKEPML